MGVIISRFRRKETTREVLERLDSKIKTIEQDGQYKEKTHKRVIGYVMVYSVGLYVLFAILYYYMYVGRTQNWVHSLLHASPLLVLPILAIFLRSSISWYYNWTLNKNRMQLTKMKDTKKKILEEVMNTETYKVAKEILDKFGCPEDQCKVLKPFVPTNNVPGNRPASPASPAPATPGQLRLRQAVTSTPIQKIMNSGNGNTAALFMGPKAKAPRLPCPIYDNNRSAFERIVDFLLKDGPSQRMALICSQCFSHNGMAMIEEFDYFSYYCAYCGKFNAAKKQRPAAPNLAYSPRLALNNTDSPPDDESPVASSDSEDENTQKHDKLDGSPDRPPSSLDETPKSADDKKQD